MTCYAPCETGCCSDLSLNRPKYAILTQITLPCEYLEMSGFRHLIDQDNFAGGQTGSEKFVGRAQASNAPLETAWSSRLTQNNPEQAILTHRALLCEHLTMSRFRDFIDQETSGGAPTGTQNFFGHVMTSCAQRETG